MKPFLEGLIAFIVLFAPMVIVYLDQIGTLK